MRLLAIDPGNEESALLVYDATTRKPVIWAKMPNEAARRMVDQYRTTRACEQLAVEMVASYGMPVGAEVFDTCMWIGRFVEKWVVSQLHGEPVPTLVYRRDVKLHICADSRAKDANIRQALIDRYGGKQRAIGRKKTPGPLYGLTGDCWSALAVAITAAERRDVANALRGLPTGREAAGG